MILYRIVIFFRHIKIIFFEFQRIHWTIGGAVGKLDFLLGGAVGNLDFLLGGAVGTWISF